MWDTNAGGRHDPPLPRGPLPIKHKSTDTQRKGHQTLRKSASILVTFCQHLGSVGTENHAIAIRENRLPFTLSPSVRLSDTIAGWNLTDDDSGYGEALAENGYVEQPSIINSHRGRHTRVLLANADTLVATSTPMECQAYRCVLSSYLGDNTNSNSRGLRKTIFR